jgi:hypothetical protein
LEVDSAFVWRWEIQLLSAGGKSGFSAERSINSRKLSPAACKEVPL